jgi:hypothetical protein
MLCALTVRKLKPGTFEEFRAKFWPENQPPPGDWTTFQMLRNSEDSDEVVTFGYFEGTAEELRRSQRDQGYDDRVAEIQPLVDSVVASGIYEFEVAVERATDRR